MTGANERPTPAARVLVVMGVSGSGKSTVGRAVAHRLGWPFGEGDDLHSRADIDKMAAGVALTDDDRRPWLLAVRAWIEEQELAGRSAVITCSALRRSYRDLLRDPQVLFVLLDGDRETLLARLQRRQGHFMPVSLLDSQLDTLERPDPDEHAVAVPITADLDTQVEMIHTALARTISAR